MSTITTDGIFDGIDEEAYHADPCEVPSLSASIATIIDTQSPLHAYVAHPRLGGRKREATPSMDRGTLVHSLALGGREAVIVDLDDWRTKAAREIRDNAKKEGKIPVLAKNYAAARAHADAIRSGLLARGFDLDKGRNEVTAVWSERGARCRGRMDHIATDGRVTILDLKTCVSAHPKKLARSMDIYGYAIQRAAYVSAIELLMPHMTGAIDFVFAFSEAEPPHAMTCVRLDGAFSDLGRRRWDRALRLWVECLSSNRWPAYSDDVMTLEAPTWALTDEMSRECRENDVMQFL